MEVVGQFPCQTTSIFAGLGNTYLRQEMTAVWRGTKPWIKSAEPLLDLPGWGSGLCPFMWWQFQSNQIALSHLERF